MWSHVYEAIYATDTTVYLNYNPRLKMNVSDNSNDLKKSFEFITHLPYHKMSDSEVDPGSKRERLSSWWHCRGKIKYHSFELREAVKPNLFRA